MTHVLYNSASDNGKGYENALEIKNRLSGDFAFDDVLGIQDMKLYLKNIPENEDVILTGGDGSLNHFANDVGDEEIPNNIYYFPTGTGNDFMKDVENFAKDGMIRINEYIRNLPTVYVNGMERKFINGIGYGIDGYCCEVADEIREKGKGEINYTSIAIKGLLFHFKPTNATVTVDGVKHTYKKVWLAPTMNGRYYGGGMNIAPAQDRLNEEKEVTLVVMYGTGKLKTLMVFPTIFKGEHIKHTEMFDILSGKEITVEFDKPTALQIDGETVRNVTSYTVRSSILSPKEDKEKDEGLKV
ncbi:MAG: diacylglycerol/lipid kinase family protein [Eubacteriales bacterium]